MFKTMYEMILRSSNKSLNGKMFWSQRNSAFFQQPSHRKAVLLGRASVVTSPHDHGAQAFKSALDLAPHTAPPSYTHTPVFGKENKRERKKKRKGSWKDQYLHQLQS